MQTAEGPQENLPRPSGPAPQAPDQAPDALLDDRVSLLKTPRGPSCLPRAPEHRNKTIYETTYRLERENQALKSQLTHQEIQLEGLVRQLNESQAIHKKAEQEISDLRKSLDGQTQLNNDLILQKHRLGESITELQDETSQDKDNGQAEINELEVMNTLTREKHIQVEERCLQVMQETLLFASQYDLLNKENNYTLGPRNHPRSHLKELEPQQTPVGSTILKRQADKLRECEKRVVDLTAQLDWCEANRRKMQREWDERIAMEMKWRDDLLAIIDYNNMSLVERRQVDLAALIPSQQSAEGAQGDSGGA